MRKTPLWSGKLNWFRLQINSRLQAAGLSLQDSLERSCQDVVCCGKADKRLYIRLPIVRA